MGAKFYVKVHTKNRMHYSSDVPLSIEGLRCVQLCGEKERNMKTKAMKEATNSFRFMYYLSVEVLLLLEKKVGTQNIFSFMMGDHGSY